jgi:hypothetical protein
MDVLLSQNGPYISVWAVMYAQACLLHGDYESGLVVLTRIEARVQSGECWMKSEYMRLLANFKYSLTLITAEVFLHTLEASHDLALEQNAHLFIDDILHDIDSVKLAMASITIEHAK